MKFRFNLESFKKFLPALQSFIIEQLKGAAVKKALKVFLGSAAGAGFQAWIIKYAVTELFEEIAQPLIKAAFVEMGYEYRRHEGKILITKLQHAREDHNETDYDSTVDVILN